MSLTDLQNLKAKRNRIIGMKKIDLMDIRPNTLNCFPQDDIEELKENIFAEGLQKPLEVYQDGDHYIHNYGNYSIQPHTEAFVGNVFLR